MSARTAAWVAMSLWAISLVLVGSGLALPSAIGRSFTEVGSYEYWREGILIVPAFATVGMIIATRRPHHTIGWLFVGIGVFGATQFITGQYGAVGQALAAGRLPGSAIATWISHQAQLIGVSGILFLLLLFPTGHLPSRRWRWVAWCLVLGAVFASISDGLRAGHMAYLFPLRIENPFGVEVLAPILDALDLVIEPLYLLGTFGALASLLARFRNARGPERQQIKWFVYAAVLGITVLFGAGIVLPEQTSGVIGNFIWGIAPAGLAVAAGIAILRYRLYDIDVIINRTLVYGVLTALLAAIYLGSVVLLQRLLDPLIGQTNQIAIVASTLTIAALFHPLRRRVQSIIDRRFYRRKYDAATTLQAFSARLREETDLTQLSDDLIAVVNDTMQPAHVSLWLRDPHEHKVAKEPII